MLNPKRFDGGLLAHQALPRRVALGIDSSYNGFGLTGVDMEDSAYFTWVYKGQGEGVDRLFDIHLFLLNCITKILRVGEIESMVMEDYAFGSHRANMLGELGGMVKMSVRDIGTLHMVSPSALKKYVVGKGTGVSKSQIMLGCYKEWDVDFTDDNAADSYALARIASGYARTADQKKIVDAALKRIPA